MLENKKVMITGGSRGIGRAMAIAMADSVTVSIAAVTKGMFSAILRENLVFNSTVFGSTSE